MRFMWQVLQSLDAAVRTHEAVNQVVKAVPLKLSGRINADAAASGQRSRVLDAGELAALHPAC